MDYLRSGSNSAIDFLKGAHDRANASDTGEQAGDAAASGGASVFGEDRAVGETAGSESGDCGEFGKAEGETRNRNVEIRDARVSMGHYVKCTNVEI